MQFSFCEFQQKISFRQATKKNPGRDNDKVTQGGKEKREGWKML
jgi:hypothetical protein